jgi:hypothetical protein
MKHVFNNITTTFVLLTGLKSHSSLLMAFEWMIFLFSIKWKPSKTSIWYSIMMNRLFVMLYIWKTMLVTLEVAGHM